MEEYTFTNEEKERINYLYGNGFIDITPEDALLIGKWEAKKALYKSEHQARLNAIAEEAEKNKLLSEEKAKKAMNDLQEMTNRAIANYEKLVNSYGKA